MTKVEGIILPPKNQWNERSAINYATEALLRMGVTLNEAEEYQKVLTRLISMKSVDDERFFQLHDFKRNKDTKRRLYFTCAEHRDAFIQRCEEEKIYEDWGRESIIYLLNADSDLRHNFRDYYHDGAPDSSKINDPYLADSSRALLRVACNIHLCSVPRCDDPMYYAPSEINSLLGEQLYLAVEQALRIRFLPGWQYNWYDAASYVSPWELDK